MNNKSFVEFMPLYLYLEKLKALYEKEFCAFNNGCVSAIEVIERYIISNQGVPVVREMTNSDILARLHNDG